jgi:hypothetical protein
MSNRTFADVYRQRVGPRPRVRAELEEMESDAGNAWHDAPLLETQPE